MSPEPQRCCVRVRTNGHNFPHYHQCKRVAVTAGPLDNTGTGAVGPVCQQHSPAATAERKKRTVEADQRRQRAWFAWKKIPLPDYLKIKDAP